MWYRVKSLNCFLHIYNTALFLLTNLYQWSIVKKDYLFILGVCSYPHRYRYVDLIWNLTLTHNVLQPEVWKREVNTELQEYEKTVYTLTMQVWRGEDILGELLSENKNLVFLYLQLMLAASRRSSSLF